MLYITCGHDGFDPPYNKRGLPNKELVLLSDSLSSGGLSSDINFYIYLCRRKTLLVIANHELHPASQIGLHIAS
jgi:hypothetical protein